MNESIDSTIQEILQDKDLDDLDNFLESNFDVENAADEMSDLFYDYLIEKDIDVRPIVAKMRDKLQKKREVDQQEFEQERDLKAQQGWQI